MKNKYFGDVNYRKYGLLRALIEVSGLDLGVCWMLTPDDGRTDGEFRRYLVDERRWRHHDPDLYEALRRLRTSEVRRDVRLADEWDLLPGASYFDSLVPDSRHGRSAYFTTAMNALAHTPVVFFDPDNGFEVKSVPVGAKDSSKYLLWNEVEEAYRRGHSVIVYQHFPRQHAVRSSRRLRAGCTSGSAHLSLSPTRPRTSCSFWHHGRSMRNGSTSQFAKSWDSGGQGRSSVAVTRWRESVLRH